MAWDRLRLFRLARSDVQHIYAHFTCKEHSIPYHSIPSMSIVSHELCLKNAVLLRALCFHHFCQGAAQTGAKVNGNTEQPAKGHGGSPKIAGKHRNSIEIQWICGRKTMVSRCLLYISYLFITLPHISPLNHHILLANS